MDTLNLRKRKGFSLAEAMMATVVLGFAAAGILLPFSSGAMAQAEGVNRTLASRLASNLMERVVNTPFANIVGTYDEFSEGQGQITDGQESVFSGSNYSKFSRTISCSYVYVPQESMAGEVKFILVTVKVYYSGKELAAIRQLISK